MPNVPPRPRRRSLTAGTRVVIAGAASLGLAVTMSTPAFAAEAPVVVGTDPYVVAAVSAPSVEFDLSASLDKADEITSRAAEAGAELVTFGELWLPGYPKDLNSDPNWRDSAGFQKYLDNSIVRGSAEWDRVIDVADDNDVYVSIGFAEKKDGLLFMSQALIGPGGEELEVRHKVRPSGSERRYFSDTTMADNLDVVETPLGRVGMLECWEHLHAQMFYPMHAKGEDVHVSAWPYLPFADEPTQFWEDTSVAESAARMYAIEGGTWAITPGVGAAFIMNPLGQIVSQAERGDEFVTATVTTQDFGGPDQFTPTGENSWGVLQMIAGTFPESAQVEDPNHQVLNLVPLPDDASTPPVTPEPTASPRPTASPTASPAPIAESQLIDDTRGGLELAPASGPAGTTVGAHLESASGETVTVWLYSDPTAITEREVSDDGEFSFSIPATASAGEHRIVVQDSQGVLRGWAEFQVTTAPGAAALASTGGSIGGIAAAAAVVLAAGWVLYTRRRKNLIRFV